MESYFKVTSSDNNEIVDLAVRLSRNHGDFPRFMVKADDQTFTRASRKGLLKIVDEMALNLKCRVFRNAGKGATIDFDLK